MLWDDASADTTNIQLMSIPSATKGSRMLSRFAVNVPVLSEHKTSTPCLNEHFELEQSKETGTGHRI